MNETVIYEITALVEAGVAPSYEEYLRETHIPELLATGHFLSARLLRSEAGRYRICYEVYNQAALEAYLEDDAQRLRADALARFPEGVRLERETWETIEEWDGRNPSLKNAVL